MLPPWSSSLLQSSRMLQRSCWQSKAVAAWGACTMQTAGLVTKQDAVTSQGLPEVPYETAAALATAGSQESVHRLPDELSSSLSQYLQRTGLRTGELRMAAQNLLADLGALGSVRAQAAAMAAADETRRLQTDGRTRKRPRRTVAELEHMLSMIELDGLDSLTSEEANAALGLSPPLHAADMAESSADLMAPPYSNVHQVAGYAITQAAGAHAVAVRILAELARADPEFSPKSMLDSRARAGINLWAVQHLWPGALRSALHIEPSPEMVKLGCAATAVLAGDPSSELQKYPFPESGRHRRTSASSAHVTWARELPNLSTSPALKRRFDLVLCNGGLGEASGGEHARRELVRRLWDMTGDVLVIIEPGTPAGFAHVKAARAQVLGVEHRRQKRDHMSSSNDSGTLEDRASQSAASGAHVVAPCPHDRPCPMEGRRMWCHFGRRLESPEFVRRVLPSARNLRQESFSYVILRRRPRPKPVLVAIAPEPRASHASDLWAIPESVVQKQILLNKLAQRQTHLNIDGMAHSGLKANVGATTDAHNMSEAQLRQQVTSLLDQLADGDTLGSHLEQDASEEAELTYYRSLGESDEHSSFSTDDSSLTPRSKHTEPSLQLLQSLANALEREGIAAKPRGSPSRRLLFSQHAQSLNCDLDHHEEPSTPISEPHTQAGGRHISSLFEQRFPSLGRGLINRLCAMEDKGIQWQADSSGGLSMDVAEFSSDLGPSMDEDMSPEQRLAAGLRAATSASQLEPAQEHAAVLKQLKREIFGQNDNASCDSDDDGPMDQAGARAEVNLGKMLDDANLQRALVESSSAWARIYRPPRIRGGHVILDLCVGGQHSSDGALTEESSSLERHTVTRSDINGWMGRSAWQLARDVTWGDQWPAWYCSQQRKIKVYDPDSKEARARKRAIQQHRNVSEEADVMATLEAYGFDKPT